MVWNLADERFQENLEAAKAYYEQHWTLCAPRSATMLDRPVGQWLSNLRRAGALEGHPEWETALREVDEDWNPSWPPEWQRHYAVVREMLAEESILAYVEPGATVHGMDIGKWLTKQRTPKVWKALTDRQRERLEAIGVVPMATELEEAAKPPTTPVSTFDKGIAALAQYKAREGTLTVPRGHTEVLMIDGQEHQVKLGVFLSNTKTRRTKLTTHKLQALADLGLDWAAA
ncbi:helicase associated domain-containing protein [Streptomyces sp. NPDC056835]|uniref:helicase associated domain-containing protein n=1 Tax=Streptomyces sp. NPDC056835 TaxID=3345956 RepID=UPI0036D0CCD1